MKAGHAMILSNYVKIIVKKTDYQGAGANPVRYRNQRAAKEFTYKG